MTFAQLLGPALAHRYRLNRDGRLPLTLEPRIGRAAGIAVPQEIDDASQRARARRPEAGYQTVGGFADALGAATHSDSDARDAVIAPARRRRLRKQYRPLPMRIRTTTTMRS